MTAREAAAGDIRHAWRRLWATPTSSAVALFTMALGLAAATTVFSVAEGVLLRPLPYADPGRVVMLWDRWTGWPATWLSESEFLDYRDKSRSLSAVGAFTDGSRNLTGGQAPERVHVGIASAGVFAVLGVRPALGRIFTEDEDRRGGARVAVISHGLWTRRFAGDPGVLGRTLMLDDSSTMIVGVMPAGFHLPLDFAGDPSDLWVPLALGPVDPTQRGNHYLNVVARLRPGVTALAAESDVHAMADRMIRDYPRAYPPEFGAFTRSLTSQVLGDVRPTVLVLTAAVGFLLLIACANVANLLLGRAQARRREMAVRASLGAGRRRIVQQLLIEAGVLVAVAGCLGVALAGIGVHVMASAAPRTIPRIQNVGLDAPVLLFALVTVAATALTCGLAPALHAARIDLHAALMESGRGAGSDRGGERVRRALVVAEVALSVMLLTGACLLARSFSRLQAVDPGFDPSSVLTTRIALPASRYPTDGSIREFYRTLVQRARALPGVQGAAIVRVLPMTGIMGDWSFRIEGQVVEAGRGQGTGDWQVVSPEYFRVMRIPIKSGRTLLETDDERATDAVVVNEMLARRAWPDGGAVGQRIRMGGGDSAWRTVVGVVSNVRHRGLDAEPRPEIYLPHAQWATGSGAIAEMSLVLRCTGDPLALAPSVRHTVQTLDPALPVTGLGTMDGVLSAWSAERRMSLIVFATLAAAAIALAAVGLYGVIGYAVGQRTAEIGLRRALGASTRSVVELVARQGTGPVAAGVVVGLAGAFVLARLMVVLLFHVSATDPLTFIAVPVLVSIVTIIAAAVPARRATRVDPLTALRSD